MLTQLSINDIILIRALNLDFGSGLHVITGETGAGKSMILGALNLSLGLRGDAGFVRLDAPYAMVATSFAPPFSSKVESLMREAGHRLEDTLVLRRQQFSDGRSRAFVNDCPVSVRFLRELGLQLVELHGQEETQNLRDSRQHMQLLDTYGKHEALLSRTARAFEVWKKALATVEQHQQKAHRVQEEIKFAQQAFTELQSLQLRDEEESFLVTERKLLMNSEKITSNIHKALALLEQEEGVEHCLNLVVRYLKDGASLAQGQLDSAVEGMDRAAIEVAEARKTLEHLRHVLTSNPDKLRDIDERLFLLRDTARKYSTKVKDLPFLRDQFEKKIEMLEKHEVYEANLEESLRAAEKDYSDCANSLTQHRMKSALKLDAVVKKELQPLAFSKAEFQTLIETLPLSQGTSRGVNQVSFQIKLNEGLPLQPLAQVASGGELARIMLALKVVLAHKDTPRTVIFDEVDAGIGGAAAQAVGARLARLARREQILVVTHAPQIAAYANNHWKILKKDTSSTTTVQARVLLDSHRREEIARMLAGSKITDAARAAAEVLMTAKDTT